MTTKRKAKPFKSAVYYVAVHETGFVYWDLLEPSKADLLPRMEKAFLVPEKSVRIEKVKLVRCK